MATSVAELRRQIASDSRRPLTPVERAAYEFCRQKAAQGLPVTQVSITLAIGSANTTGSTAAGLLNRLEKAGYIERVYYQRGVQVTIVDTGESTAPPECRATHWRNRDQKVASPSIHMIHGRSPTMARLIETEASATGKPLHEFLQDLVFNGMELWLEKRENDDG